MIYRVGFKDCEYLARLFNQILIVALLFLLLYNPQLRIMSSGFIRYVFLFLIVQLYGSGVIGRGTRFFLQNAAHIRTDGQVFRYVCFGMRFFAILLSFIFTTTLLSGFISTILGKAGNPYVPAVYAAAAILLAVMLEYCGIMKFASVLFLALARGVRIRYSRPHVFTLTLCAYWFSLILFFFGVPIILKTYDFDLPNGMLKILAFLFPITFLTINFLRKKGGASFERLLQFLSYTIALQSVFIIVDWFMPPFSVFLQSIIQKSAIALRASGVTVEAGDGLSLIQALGAMSSFQLFMFSDRVKRRPIFAAIFILQVLSIAFVGRTGFVLVAAFIFLSLVFNRHRALHLFKFFKLALVSLLVCFSMYCFLVPPRIKFVMESQFLPWAFEFAYSFVNTGNLSTSSTTYIKENMLFLPDKERTILVGDGLFRDPANPQLNYMGTDCGYVRLIFFSGFIGSFLFYTYFIVLSAMMLKCSVDSSRKAFILSIMITFFIAQIKFPFLFVATTHIFLLLLFFCLLWEHESKTCKRSEEILLENKTLGQFA